MADFKPGDTVALKSGGPTMTIARLEDVNGSMNAVCGWFNGKKREIGAFPLVMLRHASPESDSAVFSSKDDE
jgi:uncharacterized protein YodC (DUF2158 family)